MIKFTKVVINPETIQIEYNCDGYKGAITIDPREHRGFSTIRALVDVGYAYAYASVESGISDITYPARYEFNIHPYSGGAYYRMYDGDSPWAVVVEEKPRPKIKRNLPSWF